MKLLLSRGTTRLVPRSVSFVFLFLSARCMARQLSSFAREYAGRERSTLRSQAAANARRKPSFDIMVANARNDSPIMLAPNDDDQRRRYMRTRYQLIVLSTYSFLPR